MCIINQPIAIAERNKGRRFFLDFLDIATERLIFIARASLSTTSFFPKISDYQAQLSFHPPAKELGTNFHADPEE